MVGAQRRNQSAALPSALRRGAAKDTLVPLIAAALPFAVYLRTMAPTVYGLDSAELTTGAYVLGIVHSPGSPLFLLLGHAFSWLPFGDVGYRVNLLSVCSATASVACVCAILRRLTHDALVAAAGAWALAFTYYYWVSAVAAELYALHGLCIAALLWLALVWREQQKPWQLCLFAYGFGLALGNHLSLSVLAPGFAYLVLEQRWHRPRLIGLAALCGILGASVYLYLPIRSMAGTPLNYARDAGVDVATWRGFWWMVRGGMFASRFFGVPWWQVPAELGLFVYRLWSNFVGLGCLIGILGVLDDAAQPRPLRRALLLMFLGHLGFVVTYDVLDKDLMLVPIYLIWGLWVGLGARPAARLLSEWTNRRVTLSGGALLLLLSASNLVVNFRYVDISHDWSARRRGETIFQTISPGALFIGTWADVPILEYLRLVEGQRPDVETANMFFVTGNRLTSLAAEHLAASRPVYTSVPGFFRQRFAVEYVSNCECSRLTGTAAPLTETGQNTGGNTEHRSQSTDKAQ